MIEREEVIRALRLWFTKGDVFEVRVLDAVTAGFKTPHIESGYFDYEHIEQVADALSAFRSYRGAYATVNPVNPDLLARAVNRLRPPRGAPTTADGDILSRRWLLVDCDAVRPSGISSSDEEHAFALAKAREVKEGLAKMGWPAPIETDSGNGAQLMYRIGLPSEDDGLVRAVIGEIAKASDEHTSIDLTVHNPARIWRIPGTMNAKGDPTDKRPYRMAGLLNVPKNLQTVTEEHLRAITQTASAPVRTTGETFDIDSWVRQYCPELGESTLWQGGRKWVFPVCPFNAGHTNRSAVLIEQATGAIAFTCHHNGCAGNDWHKLRELREPAAYAPKNAPAADLSALTLKAASVRPAAPVVSNEAIEKDVLAGTLLGRVCRLLACVTDPPLPLEVVLPKALVLVGAALSERDGTLDETCGKGPDLARLRINTGGGQVCNFYCVLAAPSGSGKDIGGLLERAALQLNWYIGSSGSAEGLAEAYTKRSNGLLCISEMQPWLDERRWQHNATEFLVFAFNKGFFTQCFSKRSGNGSERAATYCYPNIMANVQPDVFKTIVRQTDIDNGFLGRFLFTRMPPFDCEPNVFDAQDVLSKLITCIGIFRKKGGVINVPVGYARELKAELKANAESNMTASINRLCNEYYPRLAVALSVTENALTHGESVELTDETWAKARKLVHWFHGNATCLLAGIDDVDPRVRMRECIIEKVFKTMRKLDKGRGVTKDMLGHNYVPNTTAPERREALKELVDRGLVTQKGLGFSIVRVPLEWTD